MLTWSLCICTLNRPSFLVRTLRYALLQTHLPAEVVIIDASYNWEENRAQILSKLDWPSALPLIYQSAKVRSLTFQRNQALESATSDIVFSIDDDIYLFPDTAHIIMSVYEADIMCEVAMVTGCFTSRPDGQDVESDEIGPRNIKAISHLQERLEAQLTLDRHFVPYDKAVDEAPVPASLRHLNVLPHGLINGGRTTFRRKFGVDCRWSELLRYYATHEDSDFSYRMSRFGRLIIAPGARFFHADGNPKRLKMFKLHSIRTSNLLALHAMHSTNKLRSMVRCIVSFSRFLSIYILIDLARKRFTLPSVRAYAYGISQAPLFFFRKPSDLRDWYTKRQEDMYTDWHEREG